MLYNNLPGIKVTVKDGNLVLPAEDFGTGTVLIIAPNINTGIPEADMNFNPIRIRSSEDFGSLGDNKLGPFNDTNPLARLWKQVHDAGCRSIYGVPLSGAPASLETNLETLYQLLENYFEADVILLSGVYANTLETTIETKDEFKDITTTELVLSRPIIVGDEGDEDDVIEVKRSTVEDPLTLTTNYTINEDRTSITLKASVVLEAGETITVDYTAPYNFAKEFDNFCNRISSLGRQTIGIMSVKKAPEKAQTFDLTYMSGFLSDQVKQEYSQYLQIVGGVPVWFEINNTPYLDMCSGPYAGLISILPSYSATTNKTLPGVLFSAFNLKQDQLLNLTKNHIVSPRVRNGVTVVTEGITTAKDDSDFVRLTTVRIASDAVSLVREISEPYIGEPNTLARRNALETGIRSGLNNMIKRGALTDFRFSIKATLEDQINGDMKISLDLVPVFETRRIIITIALKPVID